MLVWGIPLLAKLAVLFGNLNSSKRPIDKSDLIPPAPPSLSVIYEATNSAQQAIYGYSEPGATVYLTLNKKSVGSVITRDDGGFVFSEIRLIPGKNEVTAVAMDTAGNTSQPSNPVGIIFSDKEPKLNIDFPTNGLVVSGGDGGVEIRGDTGLGVSLVVNDRVVVVNSDGKFSTRTNIVEGENTLVFIATDRSGNTARREIVVTYKK